MKRLAVDAGRAVIRQRAPQQLVSGPAEQLLQRRIGGQHASLEIERGDAQGGVLKDRPKARLALGQGSRAACHRLLEERLGLLVGVDVRGGAIPPRDVAGGVAGGHAAAEVPAIAAVAARQMVLDLEWFSRGHGMTPGLGRCSCVVRVYDRLPLPALPARAWVLGHWSDTRELYVALVVIVHHAVGSRGPHELGHGVGQFTEARLAGAQRLLGARAFDHVRRHARQQVDVT